MVRGRLPDIIKARPQKLSHGKCRIPVNGNTVLQRPCAPAGDTVPKGRTLPVILRQNLRLKRKMIDSPALYNGRSLTAVNNPVRMFPVMLLIVLFRIVVTGDLHQIRTFTGIFPGHIIGSDRDAGISPGIVTLHQRSQLPGQLLSALPGMGIIYFIPDAPQDHTRMVAVPAYPRFHIPLMPFSKITPVIIRILRSLPHIKGLRDQEKTHLVGKLHKPYRHHVVGTADGVDAHTF